MRDFLAWLFLAFLVSAALWCLEGCDTSYHACLLPDGGFPGPDHVCDYPDAGAADGE